MISQKAIDMIMEFENDPDDYSSNPEWPGENSGITIGFGWDLGHTPAEATTAAWSKHLSEKDLDALLRTSGKRGPYAKELLSSVFRINIPYAAAEAVFKNVTIPTWIVRTLRIYPQAEALHPDCLGALVSLVFNRGTDLKGDRRIEMLEIQEALRDKKEGRIPNLILNMRRLWPNTQGLQRRREAEAKLFQEGLISTTD